MFESICKGIIGLYRVFVPVYCHCECCQSADEHFERMSKRQKRDIVSDYKPDLHWHDHVYGDTGPTSASAAAEIGTVVACTEANVANNTAPLLNAVAQGTGMTQAVGAHYTIKNFHVAISMTLRCGEFQSSALTEAPCIGWAIVIDKKPPKTTTMPTFGTIFEDSTSVQARSACFFLQMIQRDRYEIIRKGTWCPNEWLQASVNDGSSVNQRAVATTVVDLFIPYEYRVQKHTTTGDLAAISDGAVYFLWRITGDNLVTNDIVGSVNVRSRMRFYDV